MLARGDVGRTSHFLPPTIPEHGVGNVVTETPTRPAPEARLDGARTGQHYLLDRGHSQRPASGHGLLEGLIPRRLEELGGLPPGLYPYGLPGDRHGQGVPQEPHQRLDHIRPQSLLGPLAEEAALPPSTLSGLHRFRKWFLLAGMFRGQVTREQRRSRAGRRDGDCPLEGGRD